VLRHLAKVSTSPTMPRQCIPVDVGLQATWWDRCMGTIHADDIGCGRASGSRLPPQAEVAL
jgi:hypothetical protein